MCLEAVIRGCFFFLKYCVAVNSLSWLKPVLSRVLKDTAAPLVSLKQATLIHKLNTPLYDFGVL